MEKIYNHLRKIESQGKIIQGLKTFFPEHPRSEYLIERLKSFINGLTIEDITLESDTFMNQPNPEWYLYRRLALLAIDQYIKDFPFLMHTPSSLRSVFGMPTRKDRKRGKFSGMELIENALSEIENLEESIDYESVQELIDCLTEASNDFSKYEKECHKLLEYLNYNLSRNSLTDTYIPEISTHSIESLEKYKVYLEESGFKNVIHEGQEEYPYGEEEEKILTPDFICEIWNNPVWFELKEWSNFNIFLSPVKQLLTYLEANIETKQENQKSYIGILVENEVDFFNFLMSLGQNIPIRKFRELIYPIIENANKLSDNIHAMRRNFFKIGRILIENYNLQIKAEALYVGLISEFINKEIGMANTEVEAGKLILSILDKLESKYSELLIIPVAELKNIKVEPKQNLILFLGVLNN
jgi:hypothetical protein